MADVDGIGPIDGVTRNIGDGQVVNYRLDDGRVASLTRSADGQQSVWFSDSEGNFEETVNTTTREGGVVTSHYDGSGTRNLIDSEFTNSLRQLMDALFAGNATRENMAQIATLNTDTIERIDAQASMSISDSYVASTAAPRNNIDLVAAEAQLGAFDGIVRTNQQYGTQDATVVLADGRVVTASALDGMSVIQVTDSSGNLLANVTASGSEASVLNGSNSVHHLDSQLDGQTLAQVRAAFADGRVTNEEATSLAAFAQRSAGTHLGR
jgi:hypothetical protein